MKTRFITLSLVCMLLIVFIGCGTDSDGKKGTMTPENPIYTHNNLDSDEGKVKKVIKDEGEVTLEVEELSLVVKSVDELKSVIKKAKTQREKEPVIENNRIKDIEFFYTPAFNFQGYKLQMIEVNKYRFFYYFLPEKFTEGAGNHFDYDTGIVFAISREEFPVKGDSLQSISQQTGIELNSDNVIYEEEISKMNWEVDSTRAYIQFPKSFINYTDMIKYCKVNKVIIDSESGTSK